MENSKQPDTEPNTELKLAETHKEMALYDLINTGILKIDDVLQSLQESGIKIKATDIDEVSNIPVITKATLMQAGVLATHGLQTITTDEWLRRYVPPKLGEKSPL